MACGPAVYIEPLGKSPGSADEHSMRMETTLAQTLGVAAAAPPPFCTQLPRQVAGSEEPQQFWGSRPNCGQVPDAAGKPSQN